MRQNMSEAQICARMRQLIGNKYRHTHKQTAQKREHVYESSMVVECRPMKGSYKTAKQVMEAYEQADWGGPESCRRMFEEGKGTRFTKRVHVNKGAHYTAKSVSSTNRPTAHGEVTSVGRVITVKRFAGSRLTCVCKSKMY